jgi:hypothetical protein
MGFSGIRNTLPRFCLFLQLHPVNIYLKQTEENSIMRSLIVCTLHTYIITMISSGAD